MEKFFKDTKDRSILDSRDFELSSQNLSTRENSNSISIIIKQDNSKLRKFDDWMWLNHHDEFYEQSILCNPLFESSDGRPKKFVVWIKFFCFLASLYEVLLLSYNCRSLRRLIVDFEYFTTWGVFMTFGCMTSSLYL